MANTDEYFVPGLVGEALYLSKLLLSGTTTHGSIGNKGMEFKHDTMPSKMGTVMASDI